MEENEIRQLNVAGWPVPDECLIELGRISALWSILENFLDICIGKLAGFDHQDPKVLILFKHSSFPQKLDILSTLCELLVPQYPSLKGYKEVVMNLRSAQTFRNRYMHNSPWLNEETGAYEMPLGSARGTLKVSVEKIDIIDLRRVWIKIHEASLDLHKLILGRLLTPVWEQRKNKSSN